MIEITSSEDLKISDFTSLKDKISRNNNTITADSEKVVLKLFSSKIPIHKILATEEFYNNHTDLISQSTIQKENCFYAEKLIMEKIIGHNLHHGVIAIAERPSDLSIEEMSAPIMILNGVTSPENVGTIIRNCIAFGARSIIVDHKSCSPYTRRCIRVSTGNIFRANVHHTSNLSQTIDTLKNTGINIVGTANIERATNISNHSFSKNHAIIIGSEGHGIDQQILEKCDEVIRIPVDKETGSINAACSSSIFLYELAKKRAP